jgi:hypothetical protein
MFERLARPTLTQVRQEANSLGLDIGIDLNRDPVYLSGEVIPSTTFARAMLVLGKVVRTIKPAPKDHSAYQRWVEGEYLKLLAIKEPTLKSQLAALDEKSMALKEKRDKIKEQLLPVMSLVEKRKHKFFNWLYKNDIDAWIVLDPIVSVQKDGTFFEAFS